MKSAIMMVETVVDLAFWTTNALNVYVLVELMLQIFWLETGFVMMSLPLLTVTMMEETVVSLFVILKFVKFMTLSLFPFLLSCLDLSQLVKQNMIIKNNIVVIWSLYWLPILNFSNINNYVHIFWYQINLNSITNIKLHQVAH